jgi:hypothetical protein
MGSQGHQKNPSYLTTWTEGNYGPPGEDDLTKSQVGKISKVFVETYRQRLDYICTEAHKQVLGADSVTQTAHIHQMLKKIVEISMQGLGDNEKDWVLNQFMGDYIE